MTVQWVTAFLDTPRGADVDAFWLEVTGTKLLSRRGANRQFATLLPPYGDAFLRVQVTESDTPGVHFDLHVPNPSETARHALSLNADIIRDHGTFVGLTSPGGMPFCLVAPSRRAAPTTACGLVARAAKPGRAGVYRYPSQRF